MQRHSKGCGAASCAGSRSSYITASWWAVSRSLPSCTVAGVRERGSPAPDRSKKRKAGAAHQSFRSDAAPGIRWAVPTLLGLAQAPPRRCVSSDISPRSGRFQALKRQEVPAECCSARPATSLAATRKPGNGSQAGKVAFRSAKAALRRLSLRESSATFAERKATLRAKLWAGRAPPGSAYARGAKRNALPSLPCGPCLDALPARQLSAATWKPGFLTIRGELPAERRQS